MSAALARKPNAPTAQPGFFALLRCCCIFVDPDTRTVIIKLSYFPQQNQAVYKEAEAFFRAASLWPASER